MYGEGRPVGAWVTGFKRLYGYAGREVVETNVQGGMNTLGERQKGYGVKGCAKTTQPFDFTMVGDAGLEPTAFGSGEQGTAFEIV